jgi:hypothetical protein
MLNFIFDKYTYDYFLGSFWFNQKSEIFKGWNRFSKYIKLLVENTRRKTPFRQHGPGYMVIPWWTIIDGIMIEHDFLQKFCDVEYSYELNSALYTG